MANKQIQTYADMVNLQVASEAFLTQTRLGSTIDAVLGVGNKNNSREPGSVAQLFVTGGDPITGPRYKLIAHQDLSQNATTIGDLGTAAVQNKSGFSASIFLDTITNQYTLSIRSTEFADSIKDLGDVRADGVEIVDRGWAFAQVNSLEAFWTALRSGGAVNGLNGVTIPNNAALTTFLGATSGGSKVNVTGYSLGANLAEAFVELHRGEVNQAYFFNGAGTGNAVGGRTFAGVWAQYKAVYDNPFSKYPATGVVMLDTEAATAALYAYRASPGATYANLYDDPRHILALNAIGPLLQGAYSASSLLGSTSSAPRTADAQMVDLFASNYSGSDIVDTLTARSGQRHGTIRPIWYEDQPASTWTSGDFSKWDWGQGHSIVLLQDSLNLMAAFERLAPSVTEDTLAQLFKASSNNNYDSLEKAQDALGRLLGLNTPVAAATADGQYAQMDLRNAFYTRLKAIQDSPVFKALDGKCPLTLADKSLASTAKTNFAAFLSLNALSPVVLSTTDPTAIAALKGANPTLATQWDADAALTDQQRTQGQGNFTNNWLDDRAALLQAIVTRNTKDLSSISVNDPLAPAGQVTDFDYIDPASAGSATFLTTQRPGTSLGQHRLIRFGSNAGSTLVGTNSQLGDHLYGGAGIDTLKGYAGKDYLEGGAGADTLLGGLDDDTLNGGKDFDSYQIDSDGGRDTIQDSDGLGKVTLAGIVLVGGKHVAGTQAVWESVDGKVQYQKLYMPASNSYDLLVSVQGSSATARIENWQPSKSLGITLADETAPVLTLKNIEQYTAGVYDTVTGSNLGDKIDTGKNTDFVYSGNGDDYVYLGSGKDVANHQDKLTQACWRTRRASVPQRLRARGLGVVCTPVVLHQHRGLHANSAATANWLRRCGTATRHVCGLGWVGEEEAQAQQVQSMRAASTKWLGRRMNRTSAVSASS